MFSSAFQVAVSNHWAVRCLKDAVVIRGLDAELSLPAQKQ